MNIMIVDDSAMIRLRLKGLFEKNGHTIVAEASNGAEALDKFLLSKPDLVTMDIVMPGEDGISALTKIISHDSAAKVVIISAVGQNRQIIEAIKLGAKEFIIKPFESQEVLETINKVAKL